MYDGKMQRLAGKSNPDKKTRHRRMPQEDWIAVKVPPIIDQETFAAAQQQLVHNQKRSKRNRKLAYLLVSGRLRCGQCGYAMAGVTKNGTYHYYGCHRRPFFDATPRHTKRSVRATAIEPIVWQAVERALNNPALIAAEVESQRGSTSVQQADLARERQHYSSQLAQCDKDLQRWEAAYLGDAIDLADFKTKKAEIDARRASVEQALTLLDDRQRLLEQSELQTAALEDLCARLRSAMHHITLEDKRQVLDALDITVTWHPEWPTPQIAGTLSPELFAIVPNASRCTRYSIPFRLSV
jgi:site-specific DNA recombinase